MRKSSPRRRETYRNRHRFEHWYRDNTVYFITARCRARYAAFASEQAKAIFWDRFDGCLRDEKQCRLTYRYYVLLQSVRHGLCADWRDYPDTRVKVDVEKSLARALRLRAFLPDVSYKRYQ